MSKLYFTVDELNTHGCPITDEIRASLMTLIVRVSQVRDQWGKPMQVTSGLRSAADQARINPSAPKSKHLTGQAVDIADPDGAVKAWLLANPSILEQAQLWCEDAAHTPTWWHAQSVPPPSGNRWFKP